MFHWFCCHPAHKHQTSRQLVMSIECILFLNLIKCYCIVVSILLRWIQMNKTLKKSIATMMLRNVKPFNFELERGRFAFLPRTSRINPKNPRYRETEPIKKNKVNHPNWQPVLFLGWLWPRSRPFLGISSFTGSGRWSLLHFIQLQKIVQSLQVWGIIIIILVILARA